MWMSCPTIIIDDFNIDMLDQNSAQWDELKKVYMTHYSMELPNFLKSWQFYDIHIDDILTNAATQQCIYVKSCWNILNSSQANIFCIQTPIILFQKIIA
jgi:hypothetical protein